MAIEDKNTKYLNHILKISDQNLQNTEMALDGTVWQQIKEDPLTEKSSYSFKYVSGSKASTKWNIFGTQLTEELAEDVSEKKIKSEWLMYFAFTENMLRSSFTKL